MTRNRIKHIICIIVSAVLCHHNCPGYNARSVNVAGQYYSYLQQYAADPSRVDIHTLIQDMFVDSRGSVYNDIYVNVYGNPDVDVDITAYLATAGGYKNRYGYPLNIVVDEDSFRYREVGASLYLSVSKHVFCRNGAAPVDYVTRETVLVQGGKIVCIFKGEDLREDNPVEDGPAEDTPAEDGPAKDYIKHFVRKSGSLSEASVCISGHDLVFKVSFNIDGMKDKDGEVSCYLYDNRGYALNDYNSNYYTTEGKVAASTAICPMYDRTCFTDLEVAIPISELHLGRGIHRLQLLIVVWDESGSDPVEIFRSEYLRFTLSNQ